MEFKESYKHLLEPGKIGTMELRNRIIMPAMGTNLNNSDCTVSDAFVAYCLRRAEGGVGMIVTEVVAPEAEGRVITGELVLDSDKYMNSMSRLPHAIHAGGAKACLQLAHGGCYASARITGVRPKTPSSVGNFQRPEDTPRPMEIDEIHELTSKYAEAALRGKKCGFDAVEIHCAHGYMPLQFLSGYTNRRTDEFGGSLENRAKFALEIIRKTKELCGKDYPVIIRLSGAEYVPNGVTIEEACAFAKMAEEAGADAINVSAGTWDSRAADYGAVLAGEKDPAGLDLRLGVGTSVWVQPYFTPRGSLKHLAAAIKKNVTIPVDAVGSISPEMGEEILEAGEADFICVGRQTIADPDWPNKIYAGHPEQIRRCLRCNECLGKVEANCQISCQVNPEAGREAELFGQVYPATEVKRVAVVGAGPAGMQAVLTARKRGLDVTLYEKEADIGGELNHIGNPEFKADFRKYAAYIKNAVRNSGAKIITGHAATAEELASIGYDAVIVAEGSHVSCPKIPGIETSGVLDPIKVVDGILPEGKDVLVCGAGLVGCEAALVLAESGKKVTMIDQLPEHAPNMPIYAKWVLNARLAEAHVSIQTNRTIKELRPGQVVTTDKDGNEEVFSGDAVVLALGLTPNHTLANELRKIAPGIRVLTAGDTNGARKIMSCTEEGYHAARII